MKAKCRQSAVFALLLVSLGCGGSSAMKPLAYRFMHALRKTRICLRINEDHSFDVHHRLLYRCIDPDHASHGRNRRQ
jgi:hypothetical protein